MEESSNVTSTTPGGSVRQSSPHMVLSTSDSSTSHKFGPKLLIKLSENNYLLQNQQFEGMIPAQSAHKVVVKPHIFIKFNTPQDQLEGKVCDEYEEQIVQDI